MLVINHGTGDACRSCCVIGTPSSCLTVHLPSVLCVYDGGILSRIAHDIPYYITQEKVCFMSSLSSIPTLAETLTTPTNT